MIGLGRTILYATAFLVANAGIAFGADLEALKEGSMKKLVIHSAPQEVSDAAFVAPDGSEVRMSDFAGQYILLNFWATWCAPCRKEMPGLDALEAEFGSDTFRVLTVATGRNPEAALTRFFAETDIQNLPKYRDPRQGLARNMAVLGLPVTVLIDADGREIARLTGDAEWDSDSAKAILTAWMGGSPTE